MNGKTKLLYWIAGVFLLIDLCLAFAQYYDNTMDGDLVVLALPADYASEIFSNPTGWKSVRFWDNDRERVASVGTAIHQIIDGEEHDMMQSVVLHRDGHITSLDYT